VHDHWELTYVFAGRGLFHASVPHVLAPHIAVLVPPGLWHFEESAENMDTLWVGMRAAVRGSHTLRKEAVRDIVRVHCPEVEDLCLRLWRTAERHHRGVGPALDGLTWAIVAEVLRAHQGSGLSSASVVQAAVDYIRENLDKPLSVGALAVRCGFCERHLRREFMKLTGVPPHRYIERLRMQTAAHWLHETRMPVAAIARMVGYADPLHFSRVFSRVFRRAPRTLRTTQCPRGHPRRKANAGGD
jgi:AraC-like DNA-binding protein